MAQMTSWVKNTSHCMCIPVWMGKFLWFRRGRVGQCLHIYSYIKSTFEQNSADLWPKLVGFGSDGASNMQGINRFFTIKD